MLENLAQKKHHYGMPVNAGVMRASRKGSGMYKITLFVVIGVMVAGCQVMGIPKKIPADKALISNALFYNGPGGYEKSTFRFSFKSYDGNQSTGLYSAVTLVPPGEYKFSFRCVRQPANGESYPASTQSVEAGKCYIPKYIKTDEYRGVSCVSDAAGKFTQYGNGCGIGGSRPFVSGGCGVELREVACDVFKRLGRTNTINDLKSIEYTHNKSN